MKITNRDLVTSFIPALQEVASLRANSKVIYNAVKTAKSANSLSEDYFKARKAIIEANCVMEGDKPKTQKDKDGNDEYVWSTPERKVEVEKSITELLAQEVDVNIYPIKFEDLDDAMLPTPIFDKEKTKQIAVEYIKCSISATTIMALQDFIVEPTEVEAPKMAKV